MGALVRRAGRPQLGAQHGGGVRAGGHLEGDGSAAAGARRGPGRRYDRVTVWFHPVSRKNRCPASVYGWDPTRRGGVVEGGLSAREDGGLVRDLIARVAPTAAPRYLNRELSWLDFNERVPAMAARADLPVLERVKFLAIFSQNLDEFFQVRVGTLHAEALAGLDSGDMERLDERLGAIGSRVRDIVAAQSALYAEDVCPALARAGIRIVHPDHLDANDGAYLDTVFAEQVFPVLTPLAVDPAH